MDKMQLHNLDEREKKKEKKRHSGKELWIKGVRKMQFWKSEEKCITRVIRRPLL